MDHENLFENALFAGRRRRLSTAIRRGLFADDGGDSNSGGGAGGGNQGGGDDDSGSRGGDGGDSGGDLAKLKAQLDDLTGQIGKLKSKNEELIGEKQKAREEAEKRRQQAEEAARKAGDTEALEASWSEKYGKLKTDLTGQLDARDKMIQDLTAGAEAQRIASELAVQGSAKVLTKHIQDRLKTEIRDGKPVTVVLDEAGKPSAMTVDELRESFKADPAFAPLIVGSKARGSGGPGTKPAGGGKTISKAELGAMSPREKAKFYSENPDITVTD